MPVTNRWHWTSERLPAMMRAVDGRIRRSRRGDVQAMAVSDQTMERASIWRRARPGRRFLLLGLLALTAVLGAGAVVGGLALLHEREAGRILPGVSAAGVNLGGLTADEARATLASSLSDLSAGSVVVRSSIGSTSIALADVGRVPDVDAMVAAAVAVGRGGTWFDESLAGMRIRLAPVDVPLQLGYDHDRAAAAIAAFAGRMTLNPVDASISASPSGFSVTPSVDGREIDAAATTAAVDQAMRDPATRAGAVVQAPLGQLAPKLSTDDAMAARAAAIRVAAALTVSSDGHTWKIGAWRIRPWISFGWTNGTFGPVIDRSAIPTVLKTISKAVARPVRDAEFLRDKHGHIVGSMADRAGQKLDVEASVNAIAAALQARIDAATPGPVKLAIAVIAPKLTTEQAAKTAPLMVKVGSWTTYYQVAAHNGFGANITVPTRVLDGTVVAPGAVFDFWAGLGEVSLRTGYKLGGAIVNGHSVEGKALAGGICAASTTLFNAALRGGFEILTRQPHWYYITRYPLGLDATVSGSQTMRFRNDTPDPILIRGFASPGVVRYEIWSVPNGRTVSLSRPQVTNVVAGSDSTVRTTALPAGQTLRTEWPVDGKDVVVTRTVRDASGRIIHQDTFVSHYHRMIGILQIGIG
jgi:vancomycin resistance protein YoaR